MPAARTLDTSLASLYRALLFLYPAEFRQEYGHELCLAYSDRRREDASPAGLLLTSLHAVAGILAEAPKEHCHMILNDLRYALRMMRKDAAATASSILILALGIGATTLVFSLANGLLLRPLPIPRQDRLVAVGERSPTDPYENSQLNFLNFRDLRPRTHLLEDLALYGGAAASLTGDQGAERVVAAQVSDHFFTVLGVTPTLGRDFTRDEDSPSGPHVVILGDELWQRRFNRDPSVIGKTLDTDTQRYTIVGVFPTQIGIPDRAELWFPLRLDPAKMSRTDYFLHAIARLKPGVSPAQATAELSALLDQIHRQNPAADNHWRIAATPLRDYLAADYTESVLTLLGAVVCLLAIACANVGNLLLVKASARRQEMAMRSALGASRARLVRQLVSESILLGLAGGAAGVLLARLGTPALLALIPFDLPHWMSFPIDWRVLAFATAVSVFASVLFGLVPALGAFSHDLIGVLKQGSRGGGAGRHQNLLRGVLVIAEVALSVMLLAGAGLMVRSFLALRSQSLGYRSENVLSLQISYSEKRYPDGPQARQMIRSLTAAVASIPGVSSAAFTSGVPLHDGWGRIFTIEGRPVPLQQMTWINHIVVAPGYFRTLAIPLLRGRDFTDADFDAPRILIVTDSFARQYWPRGDALGKRVRFGPPAAAQPWHTIVGIVADNRHGTLKADDRPSVYLPYNSDITPSSLLLRATGDPLHLVNSVQSRILDFDRNIAISHVFTLDQLIVRAAWRDRLFAVLFAVFAALALALASIGLYALLSYTVALRAREIGVRLALGASASQVRAMIVRHGMSLAAAGLLLGLALALSLTRLVRAQLFRVSPLDAVTYATVAAVLLAVALMATLIPGRRATRIDPVTALRHD